jgi:hypothetical protein
MDDNELHKRGVDDQFSFNELMTHGYNPHGLNSTPKLVWASHPLQRVEGDSKVFYAAPGASLKLMVLPSALFAGACAHRHPGHLCSEWHGQPRPAVSGRYCTPAAYIRQGS